ncbi:hypothetical protein ACFO0N_16860 [Halobium salinum]|uniref:Uncharacterized protein n=1 Tax=Halobium salinum TaxID=1364940 RepID=A0ABD5PGN9_9EURY|nr:hypothetical protein [Halobium salinum]
MPTAVGATLGGVPSALLLGYALFVRTPARADGRPGVGSGT